MLKRIEKFPNYYVTDKGEIFSAFNNNFRKLNPIINRTYYRVTLCINKKHINKLVHRLVLETFVGPCPEGMGCRHNDGNSLNNKLENLRWDTQSENQLDAVKHGTHSRMKLLPLEIKEILELRNVLPQYEIAKIYGVSPSHICNIFRYSDMKEN